MVLPMQGVDVSFVMERLAFGLVLETGMRGWQGLRERERERESE